MSTQADSKPQRIRRSVIEAMNAWTLRQEAARQPVAERTSYPPAETILHSIPRREQIIKPSEEPLRLPYFGSVDHKTSFWRSLRRLLVWFRVVTSVMLGNLFDRVTRRDTMERRAVRLRQVIERAGGTFVKLGQQASMRIDLLPWAYCIELSKMLDTMTPFPVELALKAVERTIHRPWQEVFEVFDPIPVGSASVACVFQATLKGGAKVVVKVRRPGITELFLADLRVLDWITELAEFLTFLRPGFTRNLRSEVREILTEELDFRREGRFQDIFRRNATKTGKTFFSAPRVYFDLSGDEVLVQEFISGFRLMEIISVVEGKNPENRLLLSQLNIDPALVARRILWAAFWGSDENLFFHADPHPANIIVRPNSEVVFIDFGSCGSFNNQQLVALEQMVLSMKNQDVETMARATLSLMEPLPPVDLPSLVKQAQEEYMRVLHTFNTPAEYTEYWERTSARQWLGLIRVARKFNISINIHMLRMIRATLLYDSIVLRLDNKIDRYDEYTLFMKDRAELVKQKWRKRLRENSGDNLFLNLEDYGKTFSDLMLKAQTTLNRPIVNLGSTVDKWVFTASVLSRMLGRILFITLLAMGVVYFWRSFSGAPVSFSSVFGMVVQTKLYLLFLMAAVIFNIRHIVFRLRDRDAGASG
jgi:ubiquinone biosynthesis protein